MTVIVVRQIPGAYEAHHHLQEAEAHQAATQRNRRIDDPRRPFQVRRGRSFGNVTNREAKHLENRVVRAIFPDEVRAQRADNAGKQGSGGQAKNDELAAHPVFEAVDQHIDADVNAGTHAVGCAELGHPDEHDDAELLRPTEVERQKPVLQTGNARARGIAMDNGDKNDQRRGAHEEGNQPLLKMIEKFHGKSPPDWQQDCWNRLGQATVGGVAPTG